jgi:pseudouridine-5'-phosphate glycosidase/pseudouridine kinase
MSLVSRPRLRGVRSWLARSARAHASGLRQGRQLSTTPPPIAHWRNGILRVSEEVTDALATNRPVVALESTIYTHGALGKDLRLESIVRQHGGVPAVCGVYAGTPTVGLSESEVQQMVDEGARKVSRRDLAYLVGTVRKLARKWHTTAGVRP